MWSGLSQSALLSELVLYKAEHYSVFAVDCKLLQNWPTQHSVNHMHHVVLLVCLIITQRSHLMWNAIALTNVTWHRRRHSAILRFSVYNKTEQNIMLNIMMDCSVNCKILILEDFVSSTSSQHLRLVGICCRWSYDVQRSARWSMRSRSQHINFRTVVENTSFLV